MRLLASIEIFNIPLLCGLCGLCDSYRIHSIAIYCKKIENIREIFEKNCLCCAFLLLLRQKNTAKKAIKNDRKKMENEKTLSGDTSKGHKNSEF